MEKQWFLYMGEAGELVKENGSIEFDNRVDAIDYFCESDCLYGTVFQLENDVFKAGSEMFNILRLGKVSYSE